jgi:hypothetical protein
MVEYACKYYQGTARITVLVDREKITKPMVEFCPFHGMSNFYTEEME